MVEQSQIFKPVHILPNITLHKHISCISPTNFYC